MGNVQIDSFTKEGSSDGESSNVQTEVMGNVQTEVMGNVQTD